MLRKPTALSGRSDHPEVRPGEALRLMTRQHFVVADDPYACGAWDGGGRALLVVAMIKVRALVLRSRDRDIPREQFSWCHRYLKTITHATL